MNMSRITSRDVAVTVFVAAVPFACTVFLFYVGWSLSVGNLVYSTKLPPKTKLLEMEGGIAFPEEEINEERLPFAYFNFSHPKIGDQAIVFRDNKFIAIIVAYDIGKDSPIGIAKVVRRFEPGLKIQNTDPIFSYLW